MSRAKAQRRRLHPPKAGNERVAAAEEMIGLRPLLFPKRQGLLQSRNWPLSSLPTRLHSCPASSRRWSMLQIRMPCRRCQPRRKAGRVIRPRTSRWHRHQEAPSTGWSIQSLARSVSRYRAAGAQETCRRPGHQAATMRAGRFRETCARHMPCHRGTGVSP